MSEGGGIRQWAEWALWQAEENIAQLKAFKVTFWGWGSGEEHCGPNRTAAAKGHPGAATPGDLTSP